LARTTSKAKLGMRGKKPIDDFLNTCSKQRAQCPNPCSALSWQAHGAAMRSDRSGANLRKFERLNV